MRDLARHWLRFLEQQLPTAPDTDSMRRIRRVVTVKEFTAVNGGRMHSSVVREVRSKLETGLKAGRRRNQVKPRSAPSKS